MLGCEVPIPETGVAAMRGTSPISFLKRFALSWEEGNCLREPALFLGSPWPMTDTAGPQGPVYSHHHRSLMGHLCPRVPPCPPLGWPKCGQVCMRVGLSLPSPASSHLLSLLSDQCQVRRLLQPSSSSSPLIVRRLQSRVNRLHSESHHVVCLLACSA